MNNKTLGFIVFIAIFFIVAGQWYKNYLQDKIERVVHVTDCQISKGACRISVAKDKFLNLSILPIGIPQTQALEIEVNLEGFEANDVSVNFEGLEFDHNLMPYLLTKNTDKDFSGQGFLSLCALREMSWFANVIVESDKEILKVSFPFKTNRN